MAEDDKKPDTKVEAKAKVDANAGLVKMSKGDETLYVHPTCVKAHEDAEWEVC